MLNVKREELEFNYRERIEKRKKKDSEELELKYFLDFDGYAGNILTNDILPVLDKIHDIIHDEWEKNTIKQPVQEWMDRETWGMNLDWRREKKGNNS